MIGIGGGGFLLPFLFANFNLAEKAYQSQVYNFAIINYEKALIEEKNFLKREKALYRLVDSYYQINKWDETEKQAQKYLKVYPSGQWVFQVKYLQALSSVNKKNYSNAQNLIESLIRNYPDHSKIPKLAFTLAQVYQGIGLYDQAINTLEKLLVGYQSDRDFLKARIHYLNQNYQTALGEIVKVKMAELRVFILDEGVDLQVEILLKVEDYDQAEEIIEEYFYRIKNNEIKSKLLFYQSHISYLRGDYHKAIVRYKNFLDKEKVSFYRNDAIFFLALAYYQLKQPIIALEYISSLEAMEDKVLSSEEKARKNKLAYLIYQSLDRQEKQADYLGKLLYPGSPEEIFALEEKLKALAIKDDQAPSGQGISQEMKGYLNHYEMLEKDLALRSSLYNQIAEIYFKNNNSFLNVFFSRRAFDNSQNSTYLLSLADRLSASDDYEQAVKVYKSLLTQDNMKEKDYIYDALGHALFQSGDYRHSIEYYQKNLKVSNLRYSSSARFYLGENYRLLQNYQKAKKNFNSFLEMFPDDERSSLANLNLGFIYYYGDKDYSRAIKSLDQAYKLLSLTSDTDSKIGGNSLRNNIFQLRFRCYLDMGDEKNAIEQLELISKRDAPDLYYGNMLILAKFYFNRQDYNRSLIQYHEIINSEDSDSRPSDEVLEKAYFKRIAIKLKEGSGREAYFYLAKIHERFPESSLVREAFLSIGDHYYSQKKWVSAETVYSAFEKYNSDLDDRIYALYYLGFARQQIGKMEEAYLNFMSIKEIGKSKKIYNSFYFDALFELGVYEFDNKRLSEAKINFQEVVNYSSNQNLKKKAQANLNIIELMNEPDPYAGLKTVEAVSQKIKTVSAPVLKDQGYYLITQIYFDAKNYRSAYKTSKRIMSPSRYFGDALTLALKALLAMDQYEEAYDYGMQNYFLPDLNLSGAKKEFLYYVLVYTSKKLNRKADYEKFLQLLLKEFPNTEYLETEK